ncbi:hypothetical protein FIBSPDRAFT_869052 [Athelia psychrophila]|uniref:Uncharacterized protein n=1 Tax=Athelia psychrophila TaxID=1759441 RepID=A0A166CHJ6_9AGAM|nr:hypothetical protein FIBSPDRAFT_869052 [Fibularhizoctonia sp. CBS 109695]
MRRTHLTITYLGKIPRLPAIATRQPWHLALEHGLIRAHCTRSLLAGGHFGLL